jgi:hypothetical protein
MRIFTSVVFVCLNVVSASGWAQISVQINAPGLIQVAPPPPRHEPAPRMLPNQIWVPGRWMWSGQQYVWQRGRSERARPDYAYSPGRWYAANEGWRWSDERWTKKKQHVKERKHEGNRSGFDGRDTGGDHCPPGQAKKGRC